MMRFLPIVFREGEAAQNVLKKITGGILKLMDAFRFYMPTEVFFGKGIVQQKKDLFRNAGTRAYIITYKIPGRHYSLEDVTAVLDEFKIPYVIETEIEENPSTETVERIAASARDFAPDFIVGIGGGSPIDAAKAIGVLLKNPEAKGLDLFSDPSLKSLPIIAVPTTAGTGSEVTHFSVITRHDKGTKQAITPRIFPKYALLDPMYLMEMPLRLSCSTAVDALCHCLESYVSTAGSVLSRSICEVGFGIFSQCVDGMREVLSDPEKAASKTPFPYELREKHMLVSLIGGMANAQTGTCLPHGMSYALTHFKHIPHGLACGLLIAEYLKIFKQPENVARVEKAIHLCGFKDLDDFEAFIDTLLLLKEDITPTEEEIRSYAEEFAQQKHRFVRHPEPAGLEEVLQIYTKSLLKHKR